MSGIVHLTFYQNNDLVHTQKSTSRKVMQKMLLDRKKVFINKKSNEEEDEEEKVLAGVC